MKRIIYTVLSIHLFVILWMALWMPTKKKEKKPLHINTIVQAPAPLPKPTPLLKPAPLPKKEVVIAKVQPIAQKKPIAAKPKDSPKPQGKKTQVPDYLLKRLQESIAKIEQKRDKEMPKKALNAPKLVPVLKIDQNDERSERDFEAALIDRLQNALDLPEIGEVKIALTLKQNGSFVKMCILKSESDRNRNFLEQELKKLLFPKFCGSLTKEKEYTFVITFCNG